jgi:hypothetical protein
MIITLNNTKIELLDWTGAGSDNYEWNFWRTCVSLEDTIGFFEGINLKRSYRKSRSFSFKS